MKKETFEKAKSIQNKIDMLNDAIQRIDIVDCSGPSIMIILNYIKEDEFDGLIREKIKLSVVKTLKSEIAKLQKEFDNLK